MVDISELDRAFPYAEQRKILGSLLAGIYTDLVIIRFPGLVIIRIRGLAIVWIHVWHCMVSFATHSIRFLTLTFFLQRYPVSNPRLRASEPSTLPKEPQFCTTLISHDS